MTTPRRTATKYIIGVVVLVVAMFGSGITGAVYASHQFPDVPNDNVFHDDIDWLVDQGIADGFSDGTFRPTDPISRQAFAAMLHRYADRTGSEVVVHPYLNKSSLTVLSPCPTGTVAVGGGGGNVSGAGMYLSSSLPYGTDLDRGWQVHLESADNALRSGTAWAVAICQPES